MAKHLAIQIFGHLRTFDKTFSSFYENLILPNEKSGYEIDVFMHVWDELEYSAWQWHNDEVPELRGKKLTKEQLDFVKNNYKPTLFETTPQIKTDDETKFSEFTGGKTSYSTMLNAWFTKFRVNEIRQEYEKSSGIKYDLVLNTRADILYKNPLVIDDIVAPFTSGWLNKFDNIYNKLFYSGYHRDMPLRDERLLAASDIIYFGTPDVMNKVSSIYSTLNKKELSEHFMSWEQYQLYTAYKFGIKTIQIRYAPKNLYAPNYDWEILRLQKDNKMKDKDYFSKESKELVINKMKKYAEEFISEKINCFIAKPKQKIGPKTIWQFWDTGINERTPKLVRMCFDSVQRNCGDYNVIVLDKNNIKDYIDLPDFIYDKIGCGFKMAHFSDLLRLYLLNSYGGIWIDATIYLTAPIDSKILGADFFAFQRSSTPPNDEEIWKKFNKDYFSWNKNTPIKITNSFLVAKQGNMLLGDMLSILIDYWKREPDAQTYFFFQILFNQMVNMPNWKALNCRITNDTDIHRMQLNANKGYSDELWKSIIKDTSTHKLTYFDKAQANSVYAYILNKFEMPYEQKWQNPRSDITFTTMLFRMNKEEDLTKIKKVDRKFEEFYLASLKKLILKFGQIVLWCDKETNDFIVANELSDKVKTKVMKFEDLPRYKERDKYLTFLHGMKNKSDNKGYLLYNLTPEEVVDYLILVLSKLDVVKWAKDNDFYNTPYLFWLDAGIFNEVYAKIWQNWDGKLDVAPKNSKLVFMTHFKRIYHWIIKLTSFEDIALIKGPFEISAAAMAFNKNSVDDFYANYNKAIEFLEARENITTEQAVFGTMLKLGYKIEFAKTTDYFDVVPLAMSEKSKVKIKKNYVKYYKKKILLSIINLLPFPKLRNKFIQKKIYKGIWK